MSVVDAAVHPLVPDAAYGERLPNPWRLAMNLVPGPFGKLYEASVPDVADPAAAGDEPALARTVLTDDVDAALLLPRGRGLLPNPEHLAAVDRATNDWLHEQWLQPPADERWRGAIRLPVTDPVAAVAELERLAPVERFVAVLVPLRVHEPYGADRYLPIWEAAVAHDLPVFVLDDLASAAELVRSPVGQPIHFAENDALRTLLPFVHLASLVTSGTLGRLPGLRLVFADGGADLAAPLLWRLDKDWRSGRVEIPWVEELPSAIAWRHAAFVAQAQDGRPDGLSPSPELAQVSRLGEQLLYGSRRPGWDAVEPEDVLAAVPHGAAERVLSGNALDRLPRLRLSEEREEHP
jgi:uncharacterized protein